MTHAEFQIEGTRRFGTDPMQWRFVCPVCGHVASVEDWQKAGAEENEVAFSCIGRHTEGSKEAFSSKKANAKQSGPCNYAGGGLFKLNPMDVDGVRYFNFAPEAS